MVKKLEKCRKRRRKRRYGASVLMMMTVRIWYVSLHLRLQTLICRKIQCENCRNFCHSQCYGYSRGSVSADFECYECLLGDSEPGILFQKMYPLCGRRRMVYYLEQNGFNDMEGLCQYMSRFTSTSIRATLITILDWDLEKTQKEFESLKTEGIIKKCSKSSKVPFRFSDIKKLRMELFDPSKHISHTKPVSSPSS